ncbi:DMT family transporter [Idiomarina xiamenensis]|uniref:DMT superfamily permease n=1 Tax=Idiomarina xiamenensis 10-D-4 TaxID=740709 RepID=K2KJM7_9GAMM|nr:DMT family transporter [Idiomarina xiamenensis]EKE82794.1 DMT superfamily permease [Idiomarina xiamenensis 10-D-4]
MSSPALFSRDHPYAVIIASALVLMAELSFASVSALVKWLSDDVNFAQLVFFRNLFALLVLLPFLLRKGVGNLRTRKWHLHLLRGSVGMVAMYLFFYAIANIPLAQATLVLLLAPFLIPIISRLWLAEAISRQTIVAIAIGFSGVFIFLDPLHSELSPIVAVALIAACFAALVKTVIRRLSDTESTSVIVFYFSLLATVFSAIPLIWQWQTVSADSWLGIAAMGLLAVIGQLAMTRAFSIASPSQVGVFTYSSVLFAALFGYWFWQEPLYWHMLFGALVIMLAGYLAIRGQARRPS